MRPDTTSRTEAEAGAYEAVRGAAEWIGSEPSRAELEADTTGSEPGPDPWGDPPITPRERLTFTPDPPF